MNDLDRDAAPSDIGAWHFSTPDPSPGYGWVMVDFFCGLILGGVFGLGVGVVFF